MTTEDREPLEGGRLTPADVHDVRFPSGSMMRPGYSAAEVDRFLARMAQELSRLHAEKAELRDQVRALSADMEHAVHEAPTDQAVRLLATAQQTADQYVAEAEDFSRQMAADARVRYEEQLRTARDQAGGIIQAAQEAAARMVADGVPVGDEVPGGATSGATEEQVAYLRAFAQACRVQLRSYLEALLTDVEKEWGQADPSGLPSAPIRTPAQRAESPSSSASGGRQPAETSGARQPARTGRRRAPEPPENVAREMPLSDSTSEHPVVTADGTVEVVDQRR
jgi:DivIVA domain-containing protein